MSQITVSISKAKAQLYEIVKKTCTGDEFIIEKKGEPAIVMIDYVRYQQLQKNEDEERHRLFEKIKKNRENQKYQPDCVEMLRELRNGDY